MNWFRDRINNFRLTGSQNNDSLEQEIERRAYELWEEAGRQEESYNYYYKKAQLEQEIKPTAYKLWEEAGKPKGQFHKYLKQAELEIEIKLMTYFLWEKMENQKIKLIIMRTIIGRKRSKKLSLNDCQLYINLVIFLLVNLTIL